MVNLWYLHIRSSFASYLWFTCPMMSLESFLITELLMPMASTSLKLVSIASYSTSLFVAGNWSYTPYLRTSLSGDIMTTPSPSSSLTDDPLAWTIQNCVLLSLEKVISAIKSANTWALIADRGLYLMSNWLSSMVHCTRHPVAFGLFMAFLIGWSVITMIGCAWKYGQSFFDATINANDTFSRRGYFAFAS